MTPVDARPGLHARSGRTSPLRVVARALVVGPVVTAVLVGVFLVVAGVIDQASDLDGAGALSAVVVIVFYGLPVSLACSAGAGLAAGTVDGALSRTRTPLWARAIVGGVASTVVVGTALVRLWGLLEPAGAFTVVVLLACLLTGGLAVLAAGRGGAARREAAAGARSHDAGPQDVAPHDIGDDLDGNAGPRRRRTADWVEGLAALAVTAALVGAAVWWCSVALGGSDGSRSGADAGSGVEVPAPVPDVVVPPPSEPPAAGPPASGPPVSLARAHAELDALLEAARTAGGADLPWPAAPAVTEAPCTDDAGRPGTALTLAGRFSTRDLATATDNVDFLRITQANEAVAARIVDAWTGGHASTTATMKGEYWPTPAGTTTVHEAHVGFDGGVGEIHITAACAAGA